MVQLRGDRVYVTEIDAQAVLLDAASSTYLTANETASLIVSELQSGATLDDLVVSVTDRFEITDDVAREDCITFLRTLDERGWLLDDTSGDGAAPMRS